MDPIRPATPFFAGYRRSPEMVDQLLDTLRTALEASPTLRLGQLLCNVVGEHMLFHIWDEELIQSLRERTT